MEQEKKYFAFISYSHKDKAAAKKLHDFMEGYKLPANLNGKEDLPKRIRPIFRDEAELKGGELTPQIQEALRNSRYLIVVCSPRSAQSYYVNEEIKYFQSLGRETKILPYIIDGKPTTDEDPDCCYTPCFKELQKKYELLGGDVRDLGDKAAALKIMAPMLGVEFASLHNRFAQQERKKRNIIITAITAFALLMAGVTAWISFLYGDLDKAFEDLKSEKAKVEIEKSKVEKEKTEKVKAYEDLELTNDSLKLKKLALEKTNRELDAKNLSLQESKSIILAENAMNKIEKGDYLGARRTALEAITMSYSPEAEVALRQSWENNSGILKGHSFWVSSVCWSPDGGYLASGSYDNTVNIWDGKNGECILTLKGHSWGVTSVSWSPDGKYLASGSYDKTIKIWDANKGKIIDSLEGHLDVVNSVCWSPDGKYLASGSDDKTVKIWDANKGKIIDSLQGHSKGVNSVCWSPDNKYLVSGSLDETFIIWDVNNGKKYQSEKQNVVGLWSVDWCPNGDYFAFGSGKGSVMLWQEDPISKSQTVSVHDETVTSVSWSPDGNCLASCSWDGKVRIRRMFKEKKYSILHSKPKNLFSSVATSPNGKYHVTFDSFGNVEINDAKSNKKLKVLKRNNVSGGRINWSPDGRYLVFDLYDGSIDVWDVDSGSRVHNFEGHPKKVEFLAFTSDHRKIVAGYADGVILQWDFPPFDELIEKTKAWAGK